VNIITFFITFSFCREIAEVISDYPSVWRFKAGCDYIVVTSRATLAKMLLPSPYDTLKVVERQHWSMLLLTMWSWCTTTNNKNHVLVILMTGKDW